MMPKYVDTRYRPTGRDLVCEFRVEPAGTTLEDACENIAGESSIGTWTDISTMSPEIVSRLKPHVFSMNKVTGAVKIAYPSELFEEGNMPEILSSVAGNVFGMKMVAGLRLEDIDFPDNIIRSFRGPAFGIRGVRKALEIWKRPLVGTIIKPKMGLDAKSHARVAYEAWAGGLDIVKDDENLSSMKFNKFETRMDETYKALGKAEKETGERKAYMPNVTAETTEMLRRAHIVKEHGGTHMMVDILTCGWSGLQTLREDNEDLGLIIHAHRAGHAALTRNKSHGISMLVLAKVARLIGVDQLHVGTVVGKMEGSEQEVVAIRDEMEERTIAENDAKRVLAEDWKKVKPVFPVSSGGLHPGMTLKLLEIMGINVIAQFGGGVHGHPQGTRAGAKAVRQSVDAFMEAVPLEEYAKTHKELAVALKKFGTMK